MNFFSFCRRGALTGMLLLLGITSAQAADWPRQVTDSYGTHTLPSQPLRIVSTSVTLTGSLLAIDAPVVASGATTPNNRVADSRGFLRQWSEVAKARKLARLYIGEPSAEAVAAQMPDLILVSATGGDSALPLYDQLKTIAPTLVINYDDKSWQTLLTQLGQITGHEQQASARIADFNKQLVSLKKNETAAAAGDRPGLYRRRAQRQYLDAGIGSQGRCSNSWALARRRCRAACPPAIAGVNATISCSWAGRTSRPV